MIDLKNANLKVCPDTLGLLVDFSGTISLSTMMFSEQVYDEIGRQLVDQINKNLIQSVAKQE